MKTTRTLLVAAIAIGALLLNASPVAAKVKPKPSAACLTALDASDEIQSASADFAQYVSDYFTVVSDGATRAAARGASVLAITDWVTEMTTAMQTFNASSTPLVDRVTEAKGRYLAAAAKCRAGK